MKNRILVTTLILIILVALIVVIFNKKANENSGLSKIEQQSQILHLPDNIDISIFSSKKFLELKKYGPQDIKIDEIGRKNPFAPY